MSYLRVKHDSRLVLDPSCCDINIRQFKSDQDWTEFYGDVKDAVPHNTLKPGGKRVDLRIFVNPIILATSQIDVQEQGS